MLHHFKTAGGLGVEYSQESLEYEQGIESLIDELDSVRGAVFASGFEYPGRYTCWDMGFYNPPLVMTCKQSRISLEALNQRGEVLLGFLKPVLAAHDNLEIHLDTSKLCQVAIKPSTQLFSEEERSLQPSVFTIIRLILAFFKSDEEPYLGLYGAFGFDLIYQFENLPLHKQRKAEQREMVLYLPDEIYIVNHRKEEAFVRRYDFQFHGKSTQSLLREGNYSPYKPINKPSTSCDHESGEYARVVDKAKEFFARGDLFEVVPSQTFYTHYTEEPSALFRQMRSLNPSPYGFFINLGDEEYLVGASPEM
ncbi:MAG: chorismate-binding protein, partial [Legionellales bacterium]